MLQFRKENGLLRLCVFDSHMDNFIQVSSHSSSTGTAPLDRHQCVAVETYNKVLSLTLSDDKYTAAVATIQGLYVCAALWRVKCFRTGDVFVYDLGDTELKVVRKFKYGIASRALCFGADNKLFAAGIDGAVCPGCLASPPRDSLQIRAMNVKEGEVAGSNANIQSDFHSSDVVFLAALPAFFLGSLCRWVTIASLRRPAVTVSKRANDASSDVCVWDLNSGNCKQRFSSADTIPSLTCSRLTGEPNITHAALSEDGSTLVLGEEEHTALIRFTHRQRWSRGCRSTALRAAWSPSKWCAHSH